MANTGYKIDYTSNTIIMNYKFAEAAGKYGTPEYLLLKDIHNDYPDMKEIVRSGRAKKTARVNKRLTYKNMESYISSFENSAEILAEFNDVKMRSKKAASPYAYVLDWFYGINYRIPWLHILVSMVMRMAFHPNPLPFCFYHFLYWRFIGSVSLSYPLIHANKISAQKYLLLFFGYYPFFLYIRVY